MNIHPVIGIQQTDIESDDFAVHYMRTRIENGDDVDNEEFSFFVKKSFELIRNLKLLLGTR